MRTCPRSIAYLAAFLACSLAHADPAARVAEPAAASAFADSFGLNAADRTAALKPPAVLPPAERAWTPAADSFGLNNRLISGPADCPAADADTRSRPAPRRCVRM